jgi:EmrB/QacA subfamily drug resistance transporter
VSTAPHDADDVAAPVARWLTEPRRIRSVRERPNAWGYALGAVCVGAFMAQLDASIVTLALPALQRDFHTSIGAVTWVGLAYLVTLVATVTAAGRISDMVGRKIVYLYGFGVFIVGSALCGLAPSLLVLIGCRVLQAVGAAMLQANSVAIITIAAPRAALGRAIGVQGAAQALGLAMGPSVGGVLLAAGGWRLIFFVAVPVGLLGLGAAWIFVPRSRELGPRTSFDWIGLALFFPAVVGLLSAASFGNSVGWTSPLIVGLAVAGVVLLVAFVGREHRARSPMLDLGLFRNGRFSLGISSGLLSYLVLFGVLFLIPFYLERGLDLGTGRAGFELMTMPVFLGVTAPLAGRLADRFGARPLTAGGMAGVVAGLVLMAGSGGSTPAFVGALALVGVGLGLFTPPNNASIMGAVPRRDAGMASGVLNMTRGMGTAVGLALTGLVFGLAGGDTVESASVRHAFVVTALCLAGVAAVAGLLAALRPGGELVADPALVAR